MFFCFWIHFFVYFAWIKKQILFETFFFLITFDFKTIFFFEFKSCTKIDSVFTFFLFVFFDLNWFDEFCFFKLNIIRVVNQFRNFVDTNHNYEDLILSTTFNYVDQIESSIFFSKRTSFRIKIIDSFEFDFSFSIDWTIDKIVFRKNLTVFEKKFELSVSFKIK